MRTLARVLLTGLLLSLIACASTRVDTDYDKGHSFRSLRSFDWLPHDMGDRSDHAAVDSRLDAVIKNALRKELMARFYRQQIMGTPDFWINYRVGPLVRGKPDNASAEQEPGPLQIIDPLGTPELRQGDLMLEVIDPRNQRVVWRGWGHRLIPVNEAPMSKKMTKAVEHAVQKILQDFPPR